MINNIKRLILILLGIISLSTILSASLSASAEIYSLSTLNEINDILIDLIRFD